MIQVLNMAGEAKLKSGDKVRIIIDPPAGIPQSGTIRVVQDKPGKKIGVELDHFADYAHSLDGMVEERVDSSRNITVGKGWWTIEDNLEIVTP